MPGGQQQQNTKLKPVDAGHALEWMLQKMGRTMGAAEVADSMGKLQTLMVLDAVIMSWMARAVVEAAQQLLGASASLKSVRRKDVANDRSGSSSRSSGAGSGVCSGSSSRSVITESRGSAGVATSSSKGGREGITGSISSKGGREDITGSSNGKEDTTGSSSKGGREDDTGSSSSSSSKGGKEDIISSSSSTSRRRVMDSRDLHGEDNSVDVAGDAVRHQGGNTAAAVRKALLLVACEFSGSLGDLQQFADEAASTSTTGSATAAGGQGRAQRTSSSSTAPPGGTAAADKRLAKRLAMLPQQGLPSAVVLQLDHIGDRWSRQVLSWLQLGASEQDQVLQDVLLLAESLLSEVACPVGCCNPGCVELRGVSEVKVAAKECIACKRVTYCSRECQVDHWKVHKGLCKKLQVLPTA